MKFSVMRKELKALNRFSSTKDMRYYLCGIHVVQNNRGTYLESYSQLLAITWALLLAKSKVIVTAIYEDGQYLDKNFGGNN